MQILFSKEQDKPMGYFSSQLGQRPTEDKDKNSPQRKKARPETEQVQPGDQKESLSSSPISSQAYFKSRLGARPPHQRLKSLAQEPVSGTGAPERMVCPLCQEKLVLVDRLWHCQGRCGSHWLLDSANCLVDLAALPYGICICCEQPHALIKGDKGLICPETGQEHLLVAGGQVILAEKAPNGLCLCCLPAQPLIWRQEQLVCQAKPENHYQRLKGQVRLKNPDQDKKQDILKTIDDALRQNTAKLTINGLFDLD